jgi:hypothetical protein
MTALEKAWKAARRMLGLKELVGADVNGNKYYK